MSLKLQMVMRYLYLPQIILLKFLKTLENKISKLISKSFTAIGKPFDDLNYKKEFSVINDNSNNIEFNLF